MRTDTHTDADKNSAFLAQGIELFVVSFIFYQVCTISCSPAKQLNTVVLAYKDIRVDPGDETAISSVQFYVFYG